MKNIILSTALLIISNFCFADIDTLISISKTEFEKGSIEGKLKKDSNIIKKKGVLKIGYCKTFIDNSDDENFCEFDYIGNINNSFRVVKKTLYNGEEYIILTKNNPCKTYTFKGYPHICDSIIINFDESVTTDRKKIIEVWRITSIGISKIKNIPLSKNIQTNNIRFLNNFVLIKDNKGRYWKQKY